MKNNKRGVVLIATIVELGIVVLLALAFLNATGLLTSEDEVLNLYIARDVSRITDGFLSTPYDVSYTYPQSYDRIIFVDGNEITAAKNDSFIVGGESLVYTRSKYMSSAIVNVMTSVVLDDNFCSINKLGKKILFVNGRLNLDALKVLEEKIGIKKIPKDQLVIDVSFNKASTINQDAILNDLKKLITADLTSAGFKTSTDANLNIVLEFKDQALSSVTYSSVGETQTKPLADEINRKLAGQISMVGHSFEETKKGSTPTITITLSSREKTLSRFEEEKDEDEQMKSVFSKRVVFAFTNTYIENE